jgi:hypothetical protein
MLISNRLLKGEGDCNPIAASVSRTPPARIAHRLDANMEDKVTWLGYNIEPSSVSRGGTFKLTSFFRVEKPLGRAYRIFYHCDGPGGRIKGDHTPVKGKYPTNHWAPGDYITDEHEFKVGRGMKSGTYTCWGGFYYDGFDDSSRLKVFRGHQDGKNRLRVTTVRVR